MPKMLIKDIPHTWSLIQNEDDVQQIAEELQCEDDNYRYFFVVINTDGGIDIAYGSYFVDIERYAYEVRRDY